MKRIFSMSILLLIGTSSLFAKFYEPMSDAQFYKQIERHPFTVVFFVPYAESPADEKKLDMMDDAFERLSRRERYKKTDVAFIVIDLAELSGLVADFMLNIKVPTMMLFKGGKVVKKADGSILKQEGFLDKTEIQELIEEYFGQALNDRIRRMIDIAKTREQERQRLAQQEAQAQAQQQEQATTQVEYVTQPATTYTTYSYPRYRRYYGPRFGVGLGFGPFWGGGWRGRGWRRRW
ncbi:MAG: thioredoxin family protein [Candidatus Babeliales bacterium]